MQDHPKSVTDAEGNLTTYTYSDRDLMTRQISPVSGTSTYTYNEHGELATETDARNIVMTRTTDVLDRVTSMSYPDSTLNTTYAYDAGAFGKGRLTGITRPGETISYTYDRFGRLLQDGALAYTWDKNGNRRTITYPGAITATYTHDFGDREATLAVQVGADPPQQLVSAASYEPFGPLKTLALGTSRLGMPWPFTTYTYDGRGYLSRSTFTPAAKARTDDTLPTYSSDGLLYHRHAHDSLQPESRLDPVKDSDLSVFYFAGRPVATLDKVIQGATSGGFTTTSTLQYLTVDHLGTPILVTSTAGVQVWQGGFEPFGADYSAAPTTLRFPGQWFDVTSNAGKDVGLYYNVHRWYSPTIGAYNSPDPLWPESGGSVGSYVYSRQSPILLADPQGLFTVDPSCDCEQQLPDNIPQALGKARNWARSPQCSAALDSRPDVKNCFKRNFEPNQIGNEPVIRCHSNAPPEGNYCGSTTPRLVTTPAAVHLYPGNGRCPRDNSKIGIGATILHEILHLCGVHSESEAAEITKVCTGFDARP